MTVQEPRELDRDELDVLLAESDVPLPELTRTLLERNLQLQRALDSRVVIEQAKGMLAERLSVGIEEAFEILRFAARSEHMKLHDLARDVVATSETPPAIDEWLRRGQRR